MDDFGGYEVPLAIGSVRGLRIWSMDDFESASLTGIYRYKWQAGVNVAVCGGGVSPPAEHRAPVPAWGCGCGFWAYWGPTACLDYYGGDVAGLVEGFGRTWLGTRGFRCEKARIVALHNLGTRPESGAWQASARLERTYQVPVYRDMEAMLRDYPPTTAEEALAGWLCTFCTGSDVGGLNCAPQGGLPPGPGR